MATNLYSDAHLGFYDKHGVARPSYQAHATEEEIEKNMQKLIPNSWKLEGNLLKGKTPQGELVQTIDPNYILTGTDENGLPVFKRVG